MSRQARSLHQYFCEHAAILSSIAAFTALSYVIWRKTSFNDIGSNLFAGGLQLIFTFFIVERLISRRDDLREHPRRIAAHQDVSRWFNNVVHFYASTLRSEKMTVEQLLTRASFFRAGHNLDLSTRAPVLPERDWWHWMPDQAKKFSDTGTEILQREVASLPSDIYRAIHVFCSGPFLGIQRNLALMKSVIGDAPQRHDWFFWQGGGPTDEELKALLTVHRWALDFYAENVKSDPKLIKPWENTVGQ